MAPQDRAQRPLDRPAVRRRAELGVIATYIVELASADRKGRAGRRGRRALAVHRLRVEPLAETG